MPRIFKVSQILYFCLLLLFFVFLYLFQGELGNDIQNNILFLYGILLLPLLDSILNEISIWEIGKIFFLVALILLMYVVLYIVLGGNDIAEKLSIYVYYCLVLGVVYELFDPIFKKIVGKIIK